MFRPEKTHTHRTRIGHAFPLCQEDDRESAVLLVECLVLNEGT